MFFTTFKRACDFMNLAAQFGGINDFHSAKIHKKCAANLAEVLLQLIYFDSVFLCDSSLCLLGRCLGFQRCRANAYAGTHGCGQEKSLNILAFR